MDHTFVRWRLFYRAVDYFLDRYGIENGLGRTIGEIINPESSANTEQLYSLLDQQHRDYLRGIGELLDLADGLGQAPYSFSFEPYECISEYSLGLKEQIVSLRKIYQEKQDGWIIDYASHVMVSDELLEAICDQAQQVLAEPI